MPNDKEPAVKAKEPAVKAKEPAVKAKEPAFYVAPRKSITSKKGILSGDAQDEVKAEYLAGGEGALKAFVESGHIIKG